MTVRELAGAAGCSETTILRVVRRVSPDRIRNGVRSDFDERESVRIMGEVRKRGFVTPKTGSQPRRNDELVLSVLSAPVLRELVKIYGEKGAAKRIDHVIGFRQEALPGPVPKRMPVEQAAPLFQRVYDELERTENKRKQLELFQVN